MPKGPKEPYAVEPRKLPSGRWKGRVVRYDEMGKRHELTQTFDTKREAKQWAEAEAAKYREDPNRKPPSDETLGEYVTRWVRDTIVGRKADSTALRYRLSLAHAERIIGTIPLVKLTPRDIQSVYSALLAEGKAPSTVKHVHVVLRAALENAVTWDLIPKNPTRGIKPPQPIPHELVIPTIDQSRKFLRDVEADRFFALWVFIALTGVRRGEALALQWGDIDWEAKTVTIQRTMSGYASHRTTNPPKTKAGRRIIDLTDYLIKVLRDQRHQQTLERLARGAAWADGAWVFTTRNGTWLSPAHVYTRFKKLAKQSGLPDGMRIHDLRHTMATYWLANGIPVKVVSERLGHANISITLQIYGHVLPGMQADAAAKMDAVWLDSDDERAADGPQKHIKKLVIKHHRK